MKISTKKLCGPAVVKYIVILIVIGTIILFSGIAVGVTIRSVIFSQIGKMAVIDSTDHVAFRRPDEESASSYNIYLWNITNPDVVLAGGVPDFRECGPYEYLDLSYMTNASFSDDQTEFSYQKKILYKSKNGPNTDLVTLLNPVYYGVVLQAGSESRFLVPFISQTLQGVISGFLLPEFKLMILATTATQTLQQAKALLPAVSFFTTWANTTTVDAAYTNANSNMQVGVVNSQSLGIDMATANLLWNPSYPASFVNSNMTSGGVGLWMGVVGNSSATATLESITGLSQSQIQMVANWLAVVWNAETAATVVSLNGLSTIDDVGYAQWGTGVPTGGVSVDSTQVPEFAIWANTLFPGVTISVDTTKSLFTGTLSLFNPVNVGTFMFLAADLNTNLITLSIMYPGLDNTTVIALSAYLSSHIIGDFVITGVLQPIFAAGGGLISTRTVDCWLWGCPDPLLSALLQTPTPTFFFPNDTFSPIIVQKTGKGDLSQVGQIKSVDGVSEYTMWAEPITIEGTNGRNYPPLVTEIPQTRTIWSDQLKRSLILEYEKQVNIKGVELSRYRTSESTYAIDPKFYNYFDGFMNLTALSGIPTFSSKPHFLGLQEWSINFTSNMNPDPEKHLTFVDVDVYTGFSLSAAQRIQNSFYLESRGSPVFDTMHSGVTTGRMFPSFWLESAGELDQDTADALVKGMKGGKTLAQGMMIALVIFGSILILVGLAFLGLWYLKRNSATHIQAITIAKEPQPV